MTDLPSNEEYVQTESTQFRSAVSESLVQGIGGAINYLNDQNTANVAHFAAIAANQVVKYTGTAIYSGAVSITTSSTQISLVTIQCSANNSSGQTSISITAGYGSPVSFANDVSLSGAGSAGIGVAIHTTTTVLIPPSGTLVVAGAGVITAVDFDIGGITT